MTISERDRKRRIDLVINQAKVEAEAKPQDRALYVRWRRACVNRGFQQIAGFEPGDRIQVLAKEKDEWRAPWFGLVKEVQDGLLKATPVNNMIDLKEGVSLDALLQKGIWVSTANVYLVEPAAA